MDAARNTMVCAIEFSKRSSVVGNESALEQKNIQLGARIHELELKCAKLEGSLPRGRESSLLKQKQKTGVSKKTLPTVLPKLLSKPATQALSTRASGKENVAQSKNNDSR